MNFEAKIHAFILVIYLHPTNLDENYYYYYSIS